MPRRHAFSLIELLVVVAVVSMLVAMMLPALQRARDVARSMECLSRMRQFGLLLSSYHMDHNAWWPSSNMWGTPPSGQSSPKGIFVNLILPYAPQGPMTNMSATVGPGENFWLCPANPAPWPRSGYSANQIRPTATISSGWKVCNYQTVAGFGYGSLNSQSQSWWPKKGELKNASRQVVLVEQYGSSTGIVSYTGKYPLVRFHPGEGTNFLFGDYHAQAFDHSPHIPSLISAGVVEMFPKMQ